MNEQLREIKSAVRSIVTDRATMEQVAKSEESDGWNTEVWQLLQSNEFAGISVPEEYGGSDGSVEEACAVLHELGRRAVSVPFTEHTLMAGSLLAQAQRNMPAGLVTVVLDDAVTSDGSTITGTAKHVPWARVADQLLVITTGDNGAQAALVPASAATITNGRNLANEARDTVTFDNVAAEESWQISETDLEQVKLRGALGRAAQMAGALERVLEITVRYTSEREQFGRPVARFQAVQRHLVKLAEQTQQAMTAVAAASHNATESLDFFDVAAAKTVTGLAATAGTASAHQAHGAIGMTKEYELGQLSRRLWSWRDEYGSEASWSRDLGIRIAEAGADELWPRISVGAHDGQAQA